MPNAPKLSASSSRSTTRSRCCETLFARLYPALDALGMSYECVFVNDGSKDRSAALLRLQFQKRPAETRVVLFHANFGQHSAVMAGLAHARGEYVVTMDADLQNPSGGDRQAGREAPSGLRLRRHDPYAAPGQLVAALAVAAHEQAARVDHAGAAHRSGLHDARLFALHRRGAQPDARGEHLHSGAGLALCHESHRGADRPRGAPRRQVQVLALQPDPAQFRSRSPASRWCRCSSSP